MILWFVKLRLILFFALISVLFIFKTQITTLFLHNPELEPLTIAGIFIVFCYFFVFLKSIVSGYENFTLLSLSLVVPSIIFGVLGFFSAYFFTPFHTVLAYAISILIGSIICLPFILKQKLLMNIKGFNPNKIFLNYSMPMYLISIPSQIGFSITPILSIFFPQELIGYFSFAFMFYFAGSSVSSTLGAVLFPKVSRLNGQKKHSEVKKSLTRAFIIYTVVVVIGTTGVLLFSKLFMEIFAPKYLPGLTMFKVIVISGLILGYSNIMGSYYAAVAKIKETAILTIVQNIIVFAICYFLLATF